MNKHEHLKEARRHLERAEAIRAKIADGRNNFPLGDYTTLFAEATLYSSLATAHYLAAISLES